MASKRRMDRVDSGIVDFQLNECDKTSSTMQRSNTAPSRPRRHKRNPTTASLRSQTTDMTAQRPSSEKEKRYKPSRQRSIASSSDNSTSKYRSRGNDSKPSSRRTSVTVVDPSRPTRHYRIRSSQTVPTSNQDIDDVLALHFRSCSLFQNPSYHTHSALPSPTMSGYDAADTESAWARANDPATATSAPQAGADGIDIVGGSILAKQSEDSIAVEKSDTTTHWMSPSTRRREYERIDKANSGFRGFIRKLIPRCVSGPPPPRFYEKDQSDAGSVRRYRMDDDESDHEPSEKDDMLALRMQSRKLERPATSGTTKTKKWILCS